MTARGVFRATIRQRAARLLSSAALLVAASGVLVVSSTPSSADSSAASFNQSETISRTHYVDGKDQQADHRTVTLKVDRTTGLQDQEQIDVSWTGAHPTSNYSGDPNSSTSDLAEYPMVLLQCRGTAKTITPATCWAPLGNERETTTGEASGEDDVGTFPAWRLDRYATAAQRAQFSGLPKSQPHGCPRFGALAEHVLPFIAADGTVFYGSGQDTACGAAPPEAAAFSNSGTVSALPDNATFAMTNADGTGSDKFSVRDMSTNASLGCSARVHCALVAIPTMGISCRPGFDTDDPNASDPDDPDQSYDAGRPDRAAAACESGAKWPQGLGNRVDPAFSVSGQLWWSASNWRNRFVVPLTFAPVAGACGGLSSNSDSPSFFGSEAAMQATTQWSAKLCLTKGATSFDHVVSAEPLARTLVTTGAADAALTSAAPATPFPAPTVQAPVAATGFAISYNIDDADGNPLQTLRLTPRLLAKLMTESYPDTGAVKQNYSALASNPLNITQDPEFQALNPNVPKYTSIFGTSSLFSISTPSDVIYALTSYIEADPEARAWLDGKPDPWGMVVNPNYKHLSLPVTAWPLADSWTMPPSAFPGATPISGTCEGQYGVQPQPPYLQLISSPVESMLKIAQSVEYAQPGDGNNCNSVPGQPGTVPGSIYTAYTRAPRQFTGQRFVIGLTSLADAAHYSLATAALETSSSVDPAAQYTDGSGRTFVAPTQNGLRAAFAQLKRSATSDTWNLDYSALRSDVPSAYPGAMLVYADVPTKGLGDAAAKGYASVLRYMIGPGQVPGAEVGELPDGYLPITAANGLSAERAYTTEAADDVAAQQGLLPGQHAATPPPSSSPPSTSPPSGSTTSGSDPGSGSGGGQSPPPNAAGVGNAPGGAPAGSGPSSQGTTSGSATPSAAPSGSASPVRTLNDAQPAGKTVGAASSAYQKLVILLIVLLAVGPLGVPLFVLGRRMRTTR
jgi:hypothetical protein